LFVTGIQGSSIKLKRLGESTGLGFLTAGRFSGIGLFTVSFFTAGFSPADFLTVDFAGLGFLTAGRFLGAGLFAALFFTTGFFTAAFLAAVSLDAAFLAGSFLTAMIILLLNNQIQFR
jgi:hypothetical protein